MFSEPTITRSRIVVFSSLFALVVLLTACSGSVDVTSMDESAQIASSLERSMAMHPEDGWHEITAGVWRRIYSYPDGGQSVSHGATGIEALRWLAYNIWQPRLEALESQLLSNGESGRIDLTSLRFERHRLLELFEVLDRWERLEAVDTSSHEDHVASCTPFAAATVGPTTAAPGAKASARAMTCTGTTSYAQAVVNPPFSMQYEYSGPGETAYADNVTYGQPCNSAAYADGYPEFRDVAYSC